MISWYILVMPTERLRWLTLQNEIHTCCTTKFNVNTALPHAYTACFVKYKCSQLHHMHKPVLYDISTNLWGVEGLFPTHEATLWLRKIGAGSFGWRTCRMTDDFSLLLHSFYESIAYWILEKHLSWCTNFCFRKLWILICCKHVLEYL